MKDISNTLNFQSNATRKRSINNHIDEDKENVFRNTYVDYQ